MMIAALLITAFGATLAVSVVRVSWNGWLLALTLLVFYSPAWIGSVVGDHLGSTTPAVIGMSIELFLLMLLLLYAAARWWVHHEPWRPGVGSWCRW
jgi:hypothetical protein